MKAKHLEKIGVNELENVVYPVKDQALSFIILEDSSKAFAKVANAPIGYQPITLKKFAQIYNEGNEGHTLASMYDADGRGLLNEVSDDY